MSSSNVLDSVRRTYISNTPIEQIDEEISRSQYSSTSLVKTQSPKKLKQSSSRLIDNARNEPIDQKVISTEPEFI